MAVLAEYDAVSLATSVLSSRPLNNEQVLYYQILSRTSQYTRLFP